MWPHSLHPYLLRLCGFDFTSIRMKKPFMFHMVLVMIMLVFANVLYLVLHANDGNEIFQYQSTIGSKSGWVTFDDMRYKRRSISGAQRLLTRSSTKLPCCKPAYSTQPYFWRNWFGGVIRKLSCTWLQFYCKIRFSLKKLVTPDKDMFFNDHPS